MNESSGMEGTFFQTRTVVHVNSEALNADPLFNASFPLKFLSEVEAWCKVCSEGGLPSEMQELELAIHRHQSLYEQVTQAYTEVGKPRPSGGGTVVGGASVGSFIETLGCDVTGASVSSAVQTCCLGMHPHASGPRLLLRLWADGWSVSSCEAYLETDKRRLTELRQRRGAAALRSSLWQPGRLFYLFIYFSWSRRR